jgi:hypothetical protein
MKSAGWHERGLPSGHNALPVRERRYNALGPGQAAGGGRLCTDWSGSA